MLGFPPLALKVAQIATFLGEQAVLLQKNPQFENFPQKCCKNSQTNCACVSEMWIFFSVFAIQTLKKALIFDE
jgi:hypothetical protein